MKSTQFKASLATSLNNFINNTQYLGGILNNGVATIANNKWEDFEKLGITRAEALVNNSVSHGLLHSQQTVNAPAALGGRFNPFANVLYATLDASKANRIYEYRLMGTFPIILDGLEELSNNFINLDENRLPAKCRYTDKHASIACQDMIQDEFRYFINLFKLEERGKGYITDYLTDGELFLEYIICNNSPETMKHGILGVMKLQTELCDAIYKDKQNGIVGAFIGRRVVYEDTNPQNIVDIQYVPYQPNQIFYVNSGNWDTTGEWIVPFIERARKRYIQLSYLEDAIIIYRLVRAPERLIFTVDTGNMPHDEAEQYLRELQQSYWKTKTFDVNTADITHKFEPQTMLDAFWLSKSPGNDGIKIDRMAGGENLDQLKDLEYFNKELYHTLRVPTSRLNPESNASSNPAQNLQEELKMAKTIIGFQQRFAAAIKQGFIHHLKLTGKWEEFGLHELNLHVEMNPPNDYYELRRFQSLQIRGDAVAKMAGLGFFSTSYLMKQILGMTEGDIARNIKWRKMEAAHEWEIQQISASGPNWQNAQMQQQGAGEGGMDAGGMGGNMGGFDDGGMPMDDMGGDMGGGDIGAEEFGGMADNANAEMDENPAADMEPLS